MPFRIGKKTGSAAKPWHPQLDCKEKDCVAKRCSAINSQYCFPHTIEKIGASQIQFNETETRYALLSLIELNNET